MAEIRTVDQLRHAIDHGLTGDKVARSDPAAAPLGTDAEAGGVSPTSSEIALDAAATANQGNLHSLPRSGPLIYIGIILVVVAAIIGIIALAAWGAGP